MEEKEEIEVKVEVEVKEKEEIEVKVEVEVKEKEEIEVKVEVNRKVPSKLVCFEVAIADLEVTKREWMTKSRNRREL